jgi:hypothetical protein
MSKKTFPIYEAQVGALGSVTFFREDGSYCFMFCNGEDYTPLVLGEEAAYYVWAFIGREHPEISTLTSAKKAGRSKPKKQPSKPTKKKAK